MTSRRSRQRDKKRNERRRDEARAAFEAGDFERAQRILLEVIARAPGNARYLVDLARVELARGRGASAERALRRALELSPSYAEARALLDEPEAPPVAPRAEAERAAVDLVPPPALPSQVRDLPWPRIARELSARGLVLLPDLFDPEASVERLAELAAALAQPVAAIVAAWEAVLGTARELDLASGAPRPASRSSAAAVDVRTLLATAGGGARELEQRDLRSGRVRRRTLTVPPGGAALFCASTRPVRVGGVWGLQRVAVAERALRSGA